MEEEELPNIQPTTSNVQLPMEDRKEQGQGMLNAIYFIGKQVLFPGMNRNSESIPCCLS